VVLLRDSCPRSPNAKCQVLILSKPKSKNEELSVLERRRRSAAAVSFPSTGGAGVSTYTLGGFPYRPLEASVVFAAKQAKKSYPRRQGHGHSPRPRRSETQLNYRCCLDEKRTFSDPNSRAPESSLQCLRDRLLGQWRHDRVSSLVRM